MLQKKNSLLWLPHASPHPISQTSPPPGSTARMHALHFPSVSTLHLFSTFYGTFGCMLVDRAYLLYSQFSSIISGRTPHGMSVLHSTLWEAGGTCEQCVTTCITCWHTHFTLLSSAHTTVTYLPHTLHCLLHALPPLHTWI